jgi:hypothetical protein
MKRSEALPSKYFRAADITKPRVLVIDTVLHHKLVNNGVETEKPVCFFTDPITGKRVPQGLVLAPMKWDATEAALGLDDTADWVGKRVELFPDTTTYQGKRVPTIGIRKPAAKAKKTKPEPDPDDDVPELA